MQDTPQRRRIKAILLFLFRTFTRLEVRGMENIPPVGGVLVAVNHMTVFDAPLIFALIERKDMTALVAKTHQANPLFRWIINAVNGIWLNRDEADTRALRAATNHLQTGGALGISPEGTRSKSYTLLPAKTGVAYLSDRAKVPIVPVGISGTEGAWKCLKKLRRPVLRVNFGHSFNLPPVDRANREMSLQANTLEIMCQIAALLPEKYHGAYQGHPRIQDIQTEAENKQPATVLSF